MGEKNHEKKNSIVVKLPEVAFISPENEPSVASIDPSSFMTTLLPFDTILLFDASYINPETGDVEFELGVPKKMFPFSEFILNIIVPLYQTSTIGFSKSSP